MEKLVHFNEELIAPCGINCGTCLAYLRKTRNRCNGCRNSYLNIPITRMSCKIKNCEDLRNTDSKLCSECRLFPCARLKNIDKRYRTRYNTSLIGNLEMIRATGMKIYLENEATKWSCPNCGSVLSVHRNNCLNCDYNFNKEVLV